MSLSRSSRTQVSSAPNTCSSRHASLSSLTPSYLGLCSFERVQRRTMALPLWFNGERAVVLLYVSWILFSAPLSLLNEAVSLSAISVLALFVEISADYACESLSNSFKTRAGSSSGIILGAVTLPGLMLSKLIQLSRAVLLHQVGVEDLEYFRVQYWVASSCCFSVLVYLCFTFFHHQANTSNTLAPCGKFGARFRLGCMVLHMMVCCRSFVAKFSSGSYIALALLWVLCHGLAALKLLQHVLRTFPSCASIGEALLVTSGLVIYFGDMIARTASMIYGSSLSVEMLAILNEINRSEINTIIQGLLLCLLLFPMFWKSVLLIGAYLSMLRCSGAGQGHQIGRSIIFYVSMAIFLGVIAPLWMQFVHNFHMHPVLWVFNFVFSEPLKRLSLCIYWMVLIYASVTRFYNISKNSKTERILLRKYYHLMAVSMFLPALIFQPRFLDLAFGAALEVLLALEIIRVWRIWPLGEVVHKFMNAFTDHRDSDLLIISHFSLLLGCALPIWMSSGFNDRSLAPFAGILSLGIGDTMASMVGHKYGVLRWSKTGKKTVEGTAAGITSMLAACSVLLPFLAKAGHIFTQHWLSLVLSVTISGLLEAYTTQLDNAFIPLVFYSLLCL